MIPFFVVYHRADGSYRWGGQGEAGLQELPDDLAAAPAPRIVFEGAVVPDLDAWRASLCAAIDAAAERVRHRFITGGAGQAGVYQLKAAEAGAWAADPTAPTPLLTAEADALGIELSDLVEQVSTKVAAWAEAAGRIEGVRRAAKAEIAAVPNSIPALAAAAAIAVDWSTVEGVTP